MASWPAKDPDEVLDYALDWSPRGIDGDTITNVDSVVVTGTVVVDSKDVSGTITTIWLSGGVAGEKASIRLRITTAAGRIMDETVSIPIKAR
jgi:hypothetical protein